MGVVIVEGEEAVLGVNFGRPIVTNGDFATWLFPNYFGQDLLASCVESTADNSKFPLPVHDVVKREAQNGADIPHSAAAAPINAAIDICGRYRYSAHLHCSVSGLRHARHVFACI